MRPLIMLRPALRTISLPSTSRETMRGSRLKNLRGNNWNLALIRVATAHAQSALSIAKKGSPASDTTRPQSQWSAPAQWQIAQSPAAAWTQEESSWHRNARTHAACKAHKKSYPDRATSLAAEKNFASPTQPAVPQRWPVMLQDDSSPASTCCAWADSSER